MNFSDLVENHIYLQLPRVSPVKFHKFMLRGVEAGGLWVESQEVINSVLREAGVATSPKKALIFFPFHEISLASVSVDETSLDEKAFGL